MEVYKFNGKTYHSVYQLRQEIFEVKREAFGELTAELMEKYGVEKIEQIEPPAPPAVLTPEQKAERIRNDRDRLLELTDKYMVVDFPIEPSDLEAVKSYRQALRDIPAQPTFPDSVQWPEVPAFLQNQDRFVRYAQALLR